MEMQGSRTLRERTRNAVRADIAEAALRLFAERGFQGTTIEHIAEAAGLSQRSVFRYFASKEDIVIGKLEAGTRDLIGSLRARPADEEAWDSLVSLLTHLRTGDEAERDGPLLQMMFETSALFSVYLQKLQSLQDAVVAVLREREAAASGARTTDPVVLRALTAAAFGCFIAAQREALESGRASDVAALVDRALHAIAPARG